MIPGRGPGSEAAAEEAAILAAADLEERADKALMASIDTFYSLAMPAVDLGAIVIASLTRVALCVWRWRADAGL